MTDRDFSVPPRVKEICSSLREASAPDTLPRDTRIWVLYQRARGDMTSAEIGRIVGKSRQALYALFGRCKEEITLIRDYLDDEVREYHPQARRIHRVGRLVAKAVGYKIFECGACGEKNKIALPRPKKTRDSIAIEAELRKELGEDVQKSINLNVKTTQTDHMAWLADPHERIALAEVLYRHDDFRRDIEAVRARFLLENPENVQKSPIIPSEGLDNDEEVEYTVVRNGTE